MDIWLRKKKKKKSSDSRVLCIDVEFSISLPVSVCSFMDISREHDTVDKHEKDK